MKKAIISLTALALFFTTGCAEVAELTEVESAVIAQYAATTTLKYDKNYNKNIVKVSLEEETEEILDDEAIIDDEEPSQEVSGETSGSEGNVEEKKVDLANILNLTNATIEYEGAELMNQYQGEEGNYVEKASGETQLLVLRFLLTNTSLEPNFLEILSASPKFSISLNGKNIKALETLVTNDMTTLCDELAPEESKEQLLIFEIEDADAANLNGITLNITSGFNSSAIELE